jgi:hypothetical protein
MKTIKINKEKLNELLIIFSNLFPDYNISQNLTGMYQIIKPNNSRTHVHWIELCWICLKEILKTNKSPMTIIKEIEVFGLVLFNNFESLHPIDFIKNKFDLYKKK